MKPKVKIRVEKLLLKMLVVKPQVSKPRMVAQLTLKLEMDKIKKAKIHHRVEVVKLEHNKGMMKMSKQKINHQGVKLANLRMRTFKKKIINRVEARKLKQEMEKLKTIIANSKKVLASLQMEVGKLKKAIIHHQVVQAKLKMKRLQKIIINNQVTKVKLIKIRKKAV
jgi:hypothetical protein